MLYDNNAFSLYVDSNCVISDWDAFVNSADIFFVRAAYAPLVNGEINYDNMLATGNYLKEDPSYKTTFLELKKRGKKVFAVCEYNHMYDCETSWNRSDQAIAYKNIFKAAGNFVPDGVIIKVERLTYFQYGQGGKQQTDVNFKKGIEVLFGTLYNELRISLFLWTLLGIAHRTDPGYNYQLGLSQFFDNANAGEASYEMGISYIPTYWKAENLNGKTYQNPRDLLKEIRPLSTDEAEKLKVGSRSGWGQLSGSGTPLHSFWEFNIGMYAPFLKNASGALKVMEPFVWDVDKDALWNWMGWSEEEVPEDPGGNDGGNEGGTGNTGTVDLTEVNEKLDKLDGKLDLVLQEIKDLKSVFSKFS